MRISLIVAVARNGVIGRAGALAWKISDDLKRFREITTGKPVIMGRKTFDSIGKPLPNRSNIVVSRSMKKKEGVLLAAGIENALALAAREAARLGVDEAFIIGGADLYRETLALADRIYLTEVEAEAEGDVYFPPYHAGDWVKRADGGAALSPHNQHACRFFILDRR